MGCCRETLVAIKMSHQTDVEGSFARPRSRVLCLLLTTRRFYRLACFICSTESSQNTPQQKVFCWKNIHISREEGEEEGLVSSYTFSVYALCMTEGEQPQDQPRSQGPLLLGPSGHWGRVGEDPGNEVATGQPNSWLMIDIPAGHSSIVLLFSLL